MLKTDIKNKQNLEGGIMKYKQLKPITKQAIYDVQVAKGCDDFWTEFGRFQHKYSSQRYDQEIRIVFSSGRLCEEFTEHPEWVKYVIQHKFIEEIKEKTYHKGQRFKVAGNDGEEYLLALVGLYRCILVGVDTGNWWADNVTVKDSKNVTVEELNKMANNSSWELIG